MPEVPEHLLRRSRERREALGMASGDAPAAAPAEGQAAPPATTAAATAAPAAAAPAIVDEPIVPAGPDPSLVKLQEARQRGIPSWVFPVLLALPLWAVLYVGSFGSRGHAEAETPEQVGARVYANNCASCHGSGGEGGSGPRLAGGETKLTFPDEAQHVDWVKTGSQTKPRGTAYGDPAREGGQRVVTSSGMPAFGSTLTEAEIAAVVAHERESL